MKKLLLGVALSALMSSSAFAAKIGVSMALFDDNFLTVLRNGMIAQAKGMSGVELQVEDAQNDVAKQLDQIKNFAASGVDAIIVTLVDTNASKTLSEEAAKAGIPLVFVNLEPSDMANLPEKQVYVGSNE
ncbi:MAG: rhizopine-binding protein, partial [Mesorhizobium sp.]